MGYFTLRPDDFLYFNCKTTRETLLQKHHDRENHFGISKTRVKLACLYFWQTMTTDIDELLYGTTVRLFPGIKTPVESPIPSVNEYLSQILEWINDAIAIAKHCGNFHRVTASINVDYVLLLYTNRLQINFLCNIARIFQQA